MAGSRKYCGIFELPQRRGRSLSGSSEPRRSAYASLLLVDVLSNISDHEDEKNSSEFFAGVLTQPIPE